MNFKWKMELSFLIFITGIHSGFSQGTNEFNQNLFSSSYFNTWTEQDFISGCAGKMAGQYAFQNKSAQNIIKKMADHSCQCIAGKFNYSGLIPKGLLETKTYPEFQGKLKEMVLSIQKNFESEEGKKNMLECINFAFQKTNFKNNYLKMTGDEFVSSCEKKAKGQAGKFCKCMGDFYLKEIQASFDGPKGVEATEIQVIAEKISEKTFNLIVSDSLKKQAQKCQK